MNTHIKKESSAICCSHICWFSLKREEIRFSRGVIDDKYMATLITNWYFYIILMDTVHS